MTGSAVWPPETERIRQTNRKAKVDASEGPPRQLANCRVSIVIAARNNGSYLAEAIDSALSQTVRCEVIYADDCSFDHSLEIARRYEPRVVVVPWESHTGVCETRNRGAETACGDYLVFLDGDDVMPPDFVEEHLQAMGEETPFVYGPARGFGDHCGFWDAPEWETSDLWRQNFVNTSALWNRLAFEASGRWRDGIKTMWDWDLALRGARLGTPRRSDAVLNYRQHAESWSANNREKTHEQYILLMPEVRRMNARLNVGAVISGRVANLFPRWMSAVTQAVRQVDTVEPVELVLLDNSDHPDTHAMLRTTADRYYSTFETIRIVPHPAKIYFKGERDRRNKTARFMADAYNRLRQEMRGDVHWLIEDDILVPLEAGLKLFDTLISGAWPPHAVSGCYRNRHLPTHLVGGFFDDNCPREFQVLPDGPTPVDFCGTGCLMFWAPRTPKFWDSHYRGIPAHDWNWCLRLKERGGTVVMHPAVCCGHAVDENTVIDA